jgi:4a-hydroxytetrahydrobiopterin dehydratase
MSVPTADDLRHRTCRACEGGVPPLSAAEAQALLPSVEGWSLAHDGQRLRRTWVAKNFQAGVDFFDKIAALAEEEGHHPDLHLEGYRNVAVELWTHAIGGLSENDFILAAKINALPVAVRRQPHA